MFVGIVSLVTSRDAVLGETMGASTVADAEKAAAQIARELGLKGSVSVVQHPTKAYQRNVSVDGKLAFRLLDVDSTPRAKVPAEFRPATVAVVEEIAPKRGRGRPRKDATPVITQTAEPVKRGRGRPKGSKNKPKTAANTRTVKAGTTRP